MPADLKNFSGYILAGGRSSRMGRDKAFLEVNGKTFVQNAVDILTPVCENRIKIVLNKTQTALVEKLPKNSPYIFDIYENRGPLGGIHASLSDCKTEFAILLAVDMPLVASELFQMLAEATGSCKENAILPAGSDGFDRQPLCGVYRVADCLHTLDELLDANSNSSVFSYLGLLNVKAVKMIESNQLFNANTPEDLENPAKSSNVFKIDV